MSTNATRRSILQSGLSLGALAATGAVTSATATSHAPHEVRTTARAPWRPARVINAQTMPWSAPTELGWRIKTLFEDPATGDRLVVIQVPIGADGGENHYHDFHEWAYWLTGDFVNNEYTHPEQRRGAFQQFREGVYLDRPAYSLHGGEPDRLESQVGGTCLIMEEGGETISVMPGDPQYSDAWKTVEQWAVPRIIDTIRDMPWEPAGDAPELAVKRLVDDQQRGFRAILWRLASGTRASAVAEFARAYYFREAHQFNYVLAGDLTIQAHDAPGSEAETLTLGPDFYFERPPRAILGLADGQISESGCVWLEVTYAKGTSIANVPIEARHYD